MAHHSEENIDPKTGEAYRLIQGVKLSKYSQPIAVKPQHAQIYAFADYIDDENMDLKIPRYNRRRA